MIKSAKRSYNLGAASSTAARTAETNSALQDTYDFFSAKLDAMVSAFGKSSDLGKQLARIRSDIRWGASQFTPPLTGP